MTKDELRSAVLVGSYLRAGPLQLQPEFGAGLPTSELLEVGRELEADGVLRMVPNADCSQEDTALLCQWEITAKGWDWLGKGFGGERADMFSIFKRTVVISPTINVGGDFTMEISPEFSSSTTQTTVGFGEIVRQRIDASNVSPAQKEEAKSKLKAFLSNELIGTILKAAVEPLLHAWGIIPK
jgi:hypothetical protein